MTIRRVAWQGEDDASRIDTAELDLDEDRMSGHGTSITAEYALAWRLSVGPGWITTGLHVAVQDAAGVRTLALERTVDGSWTADRDGSGPLPIEGVGRDSVDCDLGLCPVTNTMPIRRLGLVDADRDETTLVMAWVDVPSLEIVPSPQHYASRRGVDGVRGVMYTSERRDFRAELTIDEDGIVIDYPGLARRIAVPGTTAASDRR